MCPPAVRMQLHLPLTIETATCMQPVFITDLDGTLLGHDDFSFGPIRDDFMMLLARGIRIIFNSSKTSAEIQTLCNDLGVFLPFICENGAALFNAHLLDTQAPATAPPAQIHRQAQTQTQVANKTPVAPADNVLGTDVSTLMAIWQDAIDTPLRRHCIMLDEMAPIAQHRVLGLRGNDLERALARQYSVLFAFYGPQDTFAELCAAVQAAGLSIHSGGRVHCLSGQHDKSSFNRIIRQRCSSADGAAVIIGFGDSDNDIALLSQADVACVMPRPKGPALQLADPPPNVITAPQPAPSGWALAASEALALLEQQQQQGRR